MTAQKLNKKGLSSVYETEKQPRRGAVQVPLLCELLRQGTAGQA